MSLMSSSVYSKVSLMPTVYSTTRPSLRKRTLNLDLGRAFAGLDVVVLDDLAELALS